MKKTLLSLLISLGLVGITGLVALPAYAEDDNNCVSTSILGEGGQYCDTSGDGAGVFHVLGIVLNVLTFGIGIAATVGIVISGIQYATAGDNSSRVQAAKNRILQIVIGLAIYAVFWGILQFLLPGGLFGDGSTQ